MLDVLSFYGMEGGLVLLSPLQSLIWETFKLALWQFTVAAVISHDTSRTEQSWHVTARRTHFVRNIVTEP